MDAVVFDLDDTLIVEEDFARASIAAALVSVNAPDDVDRALQAIREVWRGSELHPKCLALGIASWEGLWSTFDGCHESLAGLRAWAPQYRLLAWQAAMQAVGGNGRLAEPASEHYIVSQRAGHPVIDGAVATVRSVSHLRRGLLTNGPPDIQYMKLRQAGLAGEFDVIAISGELGIGKPTPSAFENALQRLGVGPDRTVMIGDSWTRDVEPAAALGMTTVWVAHGRAAPEPLSEVSVVDHLTPAVLESVTARHM